MTDDDARLFACAADLARAGHGALPFALPALDDVDGDAVPDDLPPIVDAHVHLFPDRLFDALWRWFDRHAWPVRHRLYADGVTAFLRGKGVRKQVALHYAHKPGMARDLNRFVAERVGDDVIGLATVHPDDADGPGILEHAFDAGLSGVKLHCHVQAVPIDDPRLDPVYEVCAARDRPVVVHAGREPRSEAYPVDPHVVCHVDRVARVLARHPRLRLVVPHLGADEFEPYAALVRSSDRLWVDTTMAIGGYLPIEDRRPLDVFGRRLERVLYGSDFPNLPYAWDRELNVLRDAHLPDDALEAVLGRNAAEVFGFSW